MNILFNKYRCYFFGYCAEKTKINQVLSITTNKGTSNVVQFTFNEEVYLTVSVDLSSFSGTYFGKEFILYIYNNRQSSISSRYIYNGPHWSTTLQISRGYYSDAGIYEIILYDRYSQEFRRECQSYYNFMINSPFSISQIFLEKQHLKLLYYGKD